MKYLSACFICSALQICFGGLLAVFIKKWQSLCDQWNVSNYPLHSLLVNIPHRPKITLLLRLIKTTWFRRWLIFCWEGQKQQAPPFSGHCSMWYDTQKYKVSKIIIRENRTQHCITVNITEVCELNHLQYVKITLSNEYINNGDLENEI